MSLGILLYCQHFNKLHKNQRAAVIVLGNQASAWPRLGEKGNSLDD